MARFRAVLAAIMVILLGGLVAPVAVDQWSPSVASAADGYPVNPTGEDDPLNIFIQMYRHRHTFAGSSPVGTVGIERNVVVVPHVMRIGSEKVTVYVVTANGGGRFPNSPTKVPVDIYRIDPDTQTPYLVDRQGQRLTTDGKTPVDWKTSDTPSDIFDITEDPVLKARIKGVVHTEWVIDAYLRLKLGGTADDREGLSERIPCASPGNMCRTSIQNRDILPSMEDFKYLTSRTNLSRADRAALSSQLDDKVKKGEVTPTQKQAELESKDAASYVKGAYQRWKTAGMSTTVAALAPAARAYSGFTTPGNPASGGTATSALSGAPGTDPGGIDFSTIQLRYLSEDKNGQLHYAYSALPSTDADHKITQGQLAAAQMSDAFFVWLNLPTSTFWVNLNPREADRIIDPKLATTDVGRILLEADLRMKKLAAQLTNPDTDTGKQFWGAPDPANLQECAVTRQWIVPKPAVVYEENGGLYIVDAPLEVKAEGEMLNGTTGDPACPVPSQRMESVFEKVILPKVEAAVNTSPDFAELRRVYLARVAAEWYRQRHTGALTKMTDSGDVSRWPALRSWTPQQVFDEYVKSYQQGEYHVTKQLDSGNYRYTFTYSDGGVDFGDVPLSQLPKATFEQEHPDLTKAVQQSFQKPSADQHDTVWLGDSGDVAPVAATAGGGDPQDFPPDVVATPSSHSSVGWLGVTIAVVALLLVAVTVAVVVRRKKLRA